MSIVRVRSRRFPLVGVLLLCAAALFAYLGVLGVVDLEREYDNFSSTSECQLDPSDDAPLPDDFDAEDCQESEERAWPGASKASPFWFFAAIPTWFVGMVATFGTSRPGRRRGFGHGWSSGSDGSSCGSDSSCSTGSSCGSSGGSD